MSGAALPLLYRDAHVAAVHKPAGMLVHRTGLDPERDVALQRVRDQLGSRVYPVHRLDRGTSGALVFGCHPEAASRLAASLGRGACEKLYLAVVRGWPPQSGVIDRPLSREKGGERRPARSRFVRIATVELPYPVSRWPTARYALVLVAIDTGRRHQIRRHLNGIAHPVVGDVGHGDGRHNRLFRERLDSHRLLLHAWSLAFPHPYSGHRVSVVAPPPAAFADVLQRLGWTLDEAWLKRAVTHLRLQDTTAALH